MPGTKNGSFERSAAARSSVSRSLGAQSLTVPAVAFEGIVGSAATTTESIGNSAAIVTTRLEVAPFLMAQIGLSPCVRASAAPRTIANESGHRWMMMG